MIDVILDYNRWQGMISSETHTKLDKDTVIRAVKSKKIENEQEPYLATLFYMCLHLVAEEAVGASASPGISQQSAALMKNYYPEGQERLAAIAEMAGNKKLAKAILSV